MANTRQNAIPGNAKPGMTLCNALYLPETLLIWLLAADRGPELQLPLPLAGYP
jgi:hypothetical protein